VTYLSAIIYLINKSHIYNLCVVVFVHDKFQIHTRLREIAFLDAWFAAHLTYLCPASVSPCVILRRWSLCRERDIGDFGFFSFVVQAIHSHQKKKSMYYILYFSSDGQTQKAYEQTEQVTKRNERKTVELYTPRGTENS
jgi:hypothetical protein